VRSGWSINVFKIIIAVDNRMITIAVVIVKNTCTQAYRLATNKHILSKFNEHTCGEILKHSPSTQIGADNYPYTILFGARA